MERASEVVVSLTNVLQASTRLRDQQPPPLLRLRGHVSDRYMLNSTPTTIADSPAPQRQGSPPIAEPSEPADGGRCNALGRDSKGSAGGSRPDRFAEGA